MRGQVDVQLDRARGREVAIGVRSDAGAGRGQYKRGLSPAVFRVSVKMGQCNPQEET